MNSERLFQILSYASVFCGFFALWISGVFGITGTVFLSPRLSADGFLNERSGRFWNVWELFSSFFPFHSITLY